MAPATNYSINSFMAAPLHSLGKKVPEKSLFYENEKHLKRLILGQSYKKITHPESLKLYNYLSSGSGKIETTKISTESYYKKNEQTFFDGKFKVSILKIYLAGQLYYSAVSRTLETSQSSLYEVIVLDSTETPNFYTKIVNSFDLNENRIHRETQLINPIDGTSIYSDSKAYNFSLSNAFSLYGTSVPVAFCDSGILKSNKVKIIQGPHTQNSLLGWFKQPKDLSETLDGTHTFQYQGLSSGAHLETILDEAYQQDSVIPISFPNCFKQNLLNEIKQAGVHTLNLSIAYHLGKENCEKLQLHSIIPKNKDLLFVMAAGNDGKYMNSQNNYVCPQSLSSGQSNTIIANTLDYNYSNRGNYIDLSVETSSTSIAAVTISNLSAQLKSRFPSLTPNQIKTIIVASTDHSNSSTKSRGKLNIDRAKKFAKSMNYGASLYTAFKEYGDHQCTWVFDRNKCLKRHFTRFKYYPWGNYEE